MDNRFRIRLIVCLAVVWFTVFLVVGGFVPWDMYLFPMVLCGVISAVKLSDCFNERQYYRDIYTIAWVVLFINSYVAPVIHFARDEWMEYIIFYPDNWNDYAFWTSLFYLTGIVIWLVVLRESEPSRSYRVKWEPRGNAHKILIGLMVVSFVLQLYVYARLGGIGGYIQAYTDATKEESAFSGTGLFSIFSEMFPYLFVMYFVVTQRGKKVQGRKVFVFFVLLLLALLFFGGLKGSRNNVIYTLMMGVLAVHIFVYKFKFIHLLYFIVFFFLFMYVGRLYKDQKGNLFDNIKEAVESRDKKNISQAEIIVLGDLSRFGVNAYELYLLEMSKEYEYKYGETYLWGMLTFIPFGSVLIREYNICSRSEAATELFYKNRTRTENSKIFGLLGEWMLNFGICTFFIPYLFMGIVLRLLRQALISIPVEDMRMLIVPVVLTLVPDLILSDMSNIMSFFVKRIAVFLLVIYCISVKRQTF